MQAAHRRVLISMTGAYQTASYDSLCVVGGAFPVKIMLQEHARYRNKSGENVKIGSIEIPARVNKSDAIERMRVEVENLWQAK